MLLLTLILFLASVLAGFVVFTPSSRPDGLLVDALFLALVLGFLLCLTQAIRGWIKASMASHISRLEAEHDRIAQALGDQDEQDSPARAVPDPSRSASGESDRQTRCPSLITSLSGGRFAASYKSE